MLSGFLITGLLLRELAATGTVSLPAYDARRTRRLLPAALLVIAITVVASAVVLPPARSHVDLDGAASAMYIGNIRFAAQATDDLQANSTRRRSSTIGRSVSRSNSIFWPAIIAFARSFAVVNPAFALGWINVLRGYEIETWHRTDIRLTRRRR